MPLKFKDERQHTEYLELSNKNTKLYSILNTLVTFVEVEFKKDVVVTSIYRTAQEQADLYKDVPVEKKVLNSPHCRWEAFDLRSSIYTDTEIQKMLIFLNCFSYREGRRVAIYHIIAGNSYHMHIQSATV